MKEEEIVPLQMKKSTILTQPEKQMYVSVANDAINTPDVDLAKIFPEVHFVTQGLRDQLLEVRTYMSGLSAQNLDGRKLMLTLQQQLQQSDSEIRVLQNVLQKDNTIGTGQPIIQPSAKAKKNSPQKCSPRTLENRQNNSNNISMDNKLNSNNLSINENELSKSEKQMMLLQNRINDLNSEINLLTDQLRQNKTETREKDELCQFLLVQIEKMTKVQVTNDLELRLQVNQIVESKIKEDNVCQYKHNKQIQLLQQQLKDMQTKLDFTNLSNKEIDTKLQAAQTTLKMKNLQTQNDQQSQDEKIKQLQHELSESRQIQAIQQKQIQQLKQSQMTQSDVQTLKVNAISIQNQLESDEKYIEKINKENDELKHQIQILELELKTFTNYKIQQDIPQQQQSNPKQKSESGNRKVESESGNCKADLESIQYLFERKQAEMDKQLIKDIQNTMMCTREQILGRAQGMMILDEVIRRQGEQIDQAMRRK